MTTKYKKSFNNPYKFRLYTNSSSDLYNYQMNNIMDSFYDNAMNQSTDGLFKVVCLSGIRTEDNDGGSTSLGDGALNQLGYAEIIVKPLTAFGNMLPDPASYSNPAEINQAILLYRSMFSARSDYVVDATNMPQFGQIINCYFEQGSISSSEFTGLRFAESKVAEFHPDYLALATIEGVQTALGAFEGANPSLLGSSEGIDPRYPPREWTYVGSNATYKGQKLQNGNLPSDLMGKATKGGTFKPEMLAEMVPLYDQMCIDFRKAFPTKQLSAWGYRPYSRQLSIKVEKPNLAAKPGTSNHGWGQAIDIHYYEDGSSKFSKLLYTKPEYIWLKNNSKKYGWYNPAWASQGGSKEEPWHWETTPSKFKRG